MSFLSRSSLSPQDAERVQAAVNPVAAAYLREHLGIDREPQEVIAEWAAQLSAGRTLATEVNLRPEHIDAMLSQARDLIRSGQPALAREKLTLVLLLDPLEARAVYAAAATLQMEQRYAEAGRLYASYVALRPLEAVGYLRLGECLLGDAAPDEAREFIEGALSMAREEKDDATVSHAEKLLSFIDTNRSAIRIRGAGTPGVAS